MSSLSPAAILTVWEVGLGQRPLDRALATLWAGGHSGDLASLPIGARDKALLDLRANTFGANLALVTQCPECGLDLELDLNARDLAASLEWLEPEHINRHGASVSVRSITSHDLAQAAKQKDPDLTAFFRTCLTSGEITPAIEADIDAQVLQREQLGQIMLALACADCTKSWSEPLDIAAFIWSEIETAAKRILTEIAELARAYGWSEKDVLALSPHRRSAYLQLARAG